MSAKTIVTILISISIFTMQFPLSLFAQPTGGQKKQANEVSLIFNFLSESGEIIPDIETNSIMVVDFSENIDKIEKYLEMIDVPIEQVLIETRIVEVRLEKEHSLGIDWSLFTAKGGAEIGQFRLGSAAGSGLEQSITFRKPKWLPLTGAEQEPFSVGIFDDNIDIVLKALATQFKTDLLSAPKITTVNNRRAKINVIKSIPYLKEIKEEEKESTGGTTTTKYTYEYKYTDEGVSLEVTPLVNPDRTITMLLYPTIKEIVRWHEMARPALATGIPTLPETDIRTAQTKVTVREGQTLVIGGLIREKITEGETNIPFLSDIPFIGSFFRSEQKTKKKTELLIFVSPTIITSNATSNMEREEKMKLSGNLQNDEIAKVKIRKEVSSTLLESKQIDLQTIEELRHLKQEQEESQSELKLSQKQIINLKKQLDEQN